MSKTRNVRIAQAARYARYLQSLSVRAMPRDLRRASADDRYEWWWQRYGQHGGTGADFSVPWSVVYKLQTRRGRGYPA